MTTTAELVASPELQLFFEKLLILKAEMKEKAEKADSLDKSAIYEEVHNKLNALIKEGK